METVPILGQLSLLALSLGLNVTFVILLAKGTVATRPQIDQVQKIADTWQRAYETSEDKWDQVSPMLNDLLVGQDTMLKILQVIPGPTKDGVA